MLPPGESQDFNSESFAKYCEKNIQSNIEATQDQNYITVLKHQRYKLLA